MGDRFHYITVMNNSLEYLNKLCKDNDRCFKGIRITGGNCVIPFEGRLNFLYAYRPNETVNVTLAPGLMPISHANLNDIA